MALTIVIAALAVCGVFFVAWALAEAWMLPMPCDACHIFFLHGDDAQVEQQLRSSLWLRQRRGLRGRILFVDCGISPEAQMTAQLFLRQDDTIHLCAYAQMTDYIRWENHSIGTGAD